MKRIISIVLCCIMLLGALSVLVFSADASTTSDIQKLKDQQKALEKQQEKIEQNLKSNKHTQKSTLEKIVDYEEQIDNLTNQIAVINDIIEKTEERIQKNNELLESKNESLKANYEKLMERIRVNYETGNLSYLPIVLGSGSMSEFLTKMDVASQIYEKDQKDIRALQSEIDQIAQIKKEIEEDQASNVESKKKLDSQSKLLKTAKSKSEALLKNLKDEEKKYREALENADEEIEKLQKQINKLASEEKYVGGTLTWPVPGYTKISSYFGYRTDPFTKEKKFHSAIDIPAPVGTKLVAANAGTVLTIGYQKNAGGNYVVIDHGGKMTTSYYHCNTIIVKKGDVVKRGQQIGTVGKTGKVTGPHVHFAVTVNGVSVNPLDYYN